jgi:NAD(P)-dependent dehydrogenase (short-subunit alcohol dehydrogenase family)
VSMPNFSLRGEIAIVTGARRGIGKAIAMAFAGAGADVAVCDLVADDGQLDAVAREIEELGCRSIAVKVDTTRRAEVEAMAQQVADRMGPVGILANNAGILIRSSLLDLPEEDWDRLMAVDLKSYYLCAQAIGRRMVEQKRGKIINTASQFSFRITPGMGPYSIAKAGVVMLTRALAQELGKSGIRVNAIAPGLVKTDFSRASWENNPDFVKQYSSQMPLGRLGETTDIIGAALFLASDASSYVTGHTILIDGGALA